VSFTIRTPTLSDAAALAEVHVSTWHETYAHLLPDDFFSPQYMQGRTEMWERVLSNPREGVSIRVAESDDSIIGFAWVGPGIGIAGEAPPRPRHLYAIYVRAEHHGTGVGQALLDETLGAGPAMLWVATQNPRAIAFYERNGFRLDGVEQTDPSAPMITDARMLR
jgi:ribosomal protein S18 acetylase RimI-like enzyme